MLNWLYNIIVTSLLFFPEEAFIAQPSDFGLQSETVTCVTNDGVKLHGWFLPADGGQSKLGQGNPQPQSGQAADGGQSKLGRATLLMLHGNAGNISGRLDKAKGWIDRGVSVLLIDYRGYGKSEGVITCENDLYLDGAAALKWLKDTKGIPYTEVILFGESLGAAPATELAIHTPLKGLILEVPFESLRAMAKLYYPWVPSFVLKDFKLDNLSKISKILCPVFIIHGTDDDVCPYEMGRRLFENAVQPKDFLTIPGGMHSDLPEKGGPEYFDRPFRFFIE